MADVRTIRLGVTYDFLNTAGCTPKSTSNVHLSTFGPVVTFVSATISSGTPPPGMAPAVCPGPSSNLLVNGTPTALGVYTYQIDALMSNGSHTFWDCVHTVALVAGCPTINITPDPLPTPQIGIAYSQALSGSAGVAPYTFDLLSGSFPPGLALASGTISGTPSAFGTYNPTIRLVDANGCTAVHEFTMAVACPTITLTPASPLDDGIDGTAYEATIGGAGGTGPYTFAVTAGALPDGLTLDADGTLHGTPTTPDLFSFTVEATDANGCTGSQAFDLEIVDTILVHPDDPALEATRGWLYLQIFTAEGGHGAPFTFAISAGALPAGLSLSSAGVLSGLATEAGSYPFTVRATDPEGYTGERAYTLDVSGLRIMVGGVDVTLQVSAAEIELTLNRQASARLEFGDEEIPGRGVDVLIYARDGVTPLFGGLTLVRRVGGMTDHNPANKADVDCVDYSIYFDDADPITIVSTVSQALEDVIAEIVAQSLDVYGITYTPTATGKTVPPIEWTEITVTDAFKRITDATGVVFRVLPFKNLDVFVPLEDPAPVTITDAEINAFDLEWSDPPNLPRNQVDLLCGPTGTAIVTQDWEADGVSTSFEVDIQAVIGDAWPGARSHAFLGPDPGAGGANVADGATVTLGSSTYTFRTALVGDVAGEVLIGADVNASLANLVAAIVDSGAPVYAPSTPVNADADGFMRYPDQLAVNALAVGVAGDSIAVSETSGAIFWYGEGTIPLDHLQLGSDPSGAAGWTQGYILENGATAVPLGAGQYSWNVNAGRGTITAAVAPPEYTILELRYSAVLPFHVRYPATLPPGTAPITFRETHTEIDNYASGLALAQQIYNRESNDRRELEVFTDVDGFLPGQALTVDTTYRGGIDDDFLVATVRINLVNADLWEYRITAQEADTYAGSFVEQWKALTSGSSSSATTPATVTPGDVSAAGDVYTDGRNAFRSNQSMGGHKLTFVDDPAVDQDAATKKYVDDADALKISADGSIPFTGPLSMGSNQITDLDDPTNAQDAATKAYVDASAGGGGGGSGQIVVSTSITIADDEGWTVPERLEIASGGVLEVAGRLEVTGTLLRCRMDMNLEGAPATLQISNEGTIDWMHPAGSATQSFIGLMVHSKKIGGWLTMGFMFIGFPATLFTQAGAISVTSTAGDNIADNGAILTANTNSQGVNHATTVGLGFRLRLPCRRDLQIVRLYPQWFSCKYKYVATLIGGDVPAQTIEVATLPASARQDMVRIAYQGEPGMELLIVGYQTANFGSTPFAKFQCATIGRV